MNPIFHDFVFNGTCYLSASDAKLFFDLSWQNVRSFQNIEYSIFILLRKCTEILSLEKLFLRDGKQHATVGIAVIL